MNFLVNLYTRFREAAMTTKTDIESRADIDRLMKRFYERMMVDPFIGFIFTHYAKLNLDEHLPVLADFWETVLFNRPVYKRGAKAMNVHFDLNQKLPLKKGYFTRWLYLFNSTTDELYSGEIANKAKTRAHSIAELMLKRIELMNSKPKTA